MLQKINLLALLKVIVAIIMLSSCNDTKVEQSVSGIIDVDVKTFSELINTEKGIILDVRTPGEVSEGYIENASVINLYDPDFISKINLMQKDSEIYVYCRSGSRSSKAAKLLQENGFTKIYNLKGGISKWKNSGYPIVKPDGIIDDKVQQVSLSDFKKMLQTEKPVLVDFHTVWCFPCKKMAPIVDEIEEEYKEQAVVVRIDVDKSKEVGNAFQITGVPVFILFKNGKEMWKHNGIISKEDLIKQIESNL